MISGASYDELVLPLIYCASQSALSIVKGLLDGYRFNHDISELQNKFVCDDTFKAI